MSTDAEAAVRAAVNALVDALLAAVAEQAAASADAPDRLHDVSSTAALLGIARSTVYAEMGSGRLRSLKARRRRLVPASAIAEYIARAGGGH